MTNTSSKILPFISEAPSRHAYASCGSTCPRCKASVFRISRRFVDLLVSLVVPIRRYRCISMACSWEGNLRTKQASLPNIARTSL